LEVVNSPPLQALERVWAEHARQLAKAPAQEQAGGWIDLVFIRSGDESYALEVEHIFEIRQAEQITPVPHVPSWVRGVYNLRGHILSVIDLFSFLGLPQPAPRGKETLTASLVMARTPEMESALLADQVLAVETIPRAQIQVPTELVHGLRAEYVEGIVELHGEEGDFIATILNLPAILADKRLVVDQEDG
jgi:purine-binding chemotaxis protein CheW